MLETARRTAEALSTHGRVTEAGHNPACTGSNSVPRTELGRATLPSVYRSQSTGIGLSLEFFGEHAALLASRLRLPA